MNDFFNNIFSLSWWFGVVFIGLILNLTAAYLKPKLDKFLSSGSVKWAERTNRQKIAREERILTMSLNPHEQVMIGIKLLYKIMLSIILILMSIMCTVLASFYYSVLYEKGNYWMGLSLIIMGHRVIVWVKSE